MSLDPRFQTIHPATELWWKQRQKCILCRNVTLQAEAGGNVIFRCKATPSGRNAHLAYCIDARSPGQPCGPSAALFERKK